MRYFIITGTSGGLGEALVRNLLEERNHLLCISRSENQRIITEAVNKGIKLDYFKFDLNNIHNIDTLMEEIFNKIDIQNIEAIYLINNAGVVTPIQPIERCEKENIIQNVNVNLLAPMLLVSSFLRLSTKLNIQKRIINISSDAGKKPYYGWSCYCSSKAGIDLFTRSVALEEENKEYPVKILSFAPGLIDTKMQEKIRSSNGDDFIEVQRFINFQKEGNLLPPNEVAKIIIKILFDANFEQGGITDIKHFK